MPQVGSSVWLFPSSCGGSVRGQFSTSRRRNNNVIEGAKKILKGGEMEDIKIEARNFLTMPVRISLIKLSGDNRILITIAEQGARLKDYYRTCVDADIPPNVISVDEWHEIGALYINTKSDILLEGIAQCRNSGKEEK